MRYANNNLLTMTKTATKIVLSSVLVLSLLACMTNTKKGSADLSLTGTQLSTLEYIPQPKVDKEGQTIPYEASANPYLQQRGKVPKQSVLAFIAAKRAYKKQDYTKAESLLVPITETDTRLSGPWVLLGDIAQQQDDLDKAVNHYQRALQINRDNVNAYIRLAKVQREQGQFIQAQHTYTKALGVWKDFPEAHLNLAILYDIYLNHPLRAQKHMEAYQFLTGGSDERVAKWLTEIQKRTGVATSLNIEKQKAESKPVS